MHGCRLWFFACVPYIFPLFLLRRQKEQLEIVGGDGSSAMRENEQEAISAIWDESVSLEKAFEKTLGIPLSDGNAPEIVLLCERATTDASNANRKVKNKYQRIRPFATFKDPSLTPWSDPEEETTFSYPSGHTARGFMYAMVHLPYGGGLG